MLSNKLRNALGSPPRVRGIGVERAEKNPALGITPAGAGNRTALSIRMCRCWDHPRGCGE